MQRSRAELQETLEELEAAVQKLLASTSSASDVWAKYSALVRAALAYAGPADNQWMRDRIADIENNYGVTNPYLKERYRS